MYEDLVWRNLEERLSTLIEKLVDNELSGSEFEVLEAEEELEVDVDNRYYGVCPSCLATFDYSQSDIGKLVRCRVCHAPMRLRKISV